MLLNRDMENKLLVRICAYDWGRRLFEKYGYENLKPNAGLTDADFDPDNPDYPF